MRGSGLQARGGTVGETDGLVACNQLVVSTLDILVDDDFFTKVCSWQPMQHTARAVFRKTTCKNEYFNSTFLSCSAASDSVGAWVGGTFPKTRLLATYLSPAVPR